MVVGHSKVAEVEQKPVGRAVAVHHMVVEAVEAVSLGVEAVSLGEEGAFAAAVLAAVELWGERFSTVPITCNLTRARKSLGGRFSTCTKINFPLPGYRRSLSRQ